MASVDGRRGGGAAARLRPCAATRRDPLNVAALRADDELIELVRRDRVPPAVTDPLVRLLVAWRAEVNRPH
ncbi:hypothetical protein ACQEVB_03685 [Pseudonocardia sp. CA-107938]|uniref:hypothetical protein n=1 Tax=Pseudonocardia sp. CA-107938 TaxID=3240021 RepID=UPI003D8F0C3A